MKSKLRVTLFSILILCHSCSASCTDKELDAWQDFLEELEQIL